MGTSDTKKAAKYVFSLYQLLNLSFFRIANSDGTKIKLNLSEHLTTLCSMKGL